MDHARRKYNDACYQQTNPDYCSILAHSKNQTEIV